MVMHSLQGLKKGYSMIVNLKYLVNSLPIFIACVDRNYCFQFVNKTYEEWFLIPEDEILGMSMKEVLGDAMFEKNKGYADKALNGEKVKFNITHICKKGIERNLHVQYFPYLIPTGNVIGFFALAYEENT
jgi:PAS domain S-box-containing protein